MALDSTLYRVFSGRPGTLGFDIGLSEDGAFWLSFLRELKARGLGGVRLVVNDAHQGLVVAIQAVFVGAAWQRCRVHFLCNLLAHVDRFAQSMVSAMAMALLPLGIVHSDPPQLEQAI